jgi:iron complex outermembrane receptor protein
MLMGAICVTAGLLLGATGALAQEAEEIPAPEPESEMAEELPVEEADLDVAEDEPEPDEFKGIEEITVTATKRAESLQDVPVSVTALNAQMIRDTDLSQFNRLQNFVPNLQILPVTDSRSTSIRIRGIGSVGENAGVDPAVGTFIDGVYQGRAGMSVTDLLDIENVQVLRGPQGTLFGKNTTAGAILINTKRPVHDWETYVEALFGTYSNYEIRGSFNAPIVEDKLAARLSGYRVWRDGFDLNRFNGEMVNDANKWGARAKVLWDITPELSVLVSGDYNQDSSTCCVGDIVSYEGPALLGTTFQNLASTTGIPLPPVDPFDRIVDANVDPKNNVTTAGAAVELDYDWADYSIEWLNAYRHYVNDSQFDGDFSLYDGVISWTDVDLNQFSSELTLTSPDTEKYNYTAGLYFFYMSMDTLDRNGYEQGWVDANTARLAGSVIFPVPVVNINENDHKTLTFAAYGEGAYNFIPDVLSLTGGARVTWEDKSRDGLNSSTCEINAPPVCGPTLEQFQQRSVTNVSGRLMLRYWPPLDRVLPTDDFMLYGSFATGFKSGGFNQLRTNDSPSEFDDEKALSYELGIKTVWFDRRVTMNLTGFYTDYRDFQAQTFDGSSINIRNAGRLFSTGLEAEFVYMPIDQLTFGANLGFNVAQYDEFLEAAATVPQTDAAGQQFRDSLPFPTPGLPNGLACSIVAGAGCNPFQDLSGKTLDKAPRWDLSLNAAYEEEIPFIPVSELMFFARADYNLNSPVYLDQDLDPATYQDFRHLLDLRAGLRRDSGVWKMQNWEAAFWVRNVTDEGYNVVSTDVPIINGYFGVNGPPRQIGGTFKFNF